MGRYGALLPLFRLVGVPCIAAFRRVKSLLCHHSDRPKLANRSVGYFAGATSLTGVPSALVFSPCLLASSRSRSISPARRSCTTRVSSAFFRSYRNTVYSSELTIVSQFLSKFLHASRSLSHAN